MSQQVIEKIQDLLFHVSNLTDLAEKNSVSFFSETKNWMQKVETTFIHSKIAAGAQVAVFRGILTSVDRDELIPEGLSFRRTPSRAKLKRASAMFFLQKSVDIIYSYLLQISAALGAINRENTP